ncbi:hypothetical protein THRCLA_21175 [Thraustotheca clavata]|uniref:Uncharacterized protein n=1 Tax=Thraustotheca clavata TaxID=74557 RepID=A0A1V9ZZD5_9STRA|nr:hypothetical protein THRCLA_21175 [Thraustotheca clavata]
MDAQYLQALPLEMLEPLDSSQILTEEDLKCLMEGLELFSSADSDEESKISRYMVDHRIPMLGRRKSNQPSYLCGPPMAPTIEIGQRQKIISVKRQEASARRRRIQGRYAGLETKFIPITQLQGPPSQSKP